jgi:hypothetical protein
MELQSQAEQVAKSDMLRQKFASWDQPRTTEQLLGFIARQEEKFQNFDLGDEELKLTA